MIHQSTGNGRNRSTEKSRDNEKNPFRTASPSPMLWKADGVDHINIFREGKTELGRDLEHGSSLPLRHSIFGKFNTIEGFWYYIQSEERDDRVRQLTGIKLNRFVKHLTTTRVFNFRAIILDANYQRIKQHKELCDALIASTLPFDLYSVIESGIRIRPPYAKWLKLGIEEIRLALQEQREPDFTLFKDHRDKDIYHYVLPNRDIS